MKVLYIFGAILLMLSACVNHTPFYNANHQSWQSAKPNNNAIDHTIFLIGDSGEPIVGKPDPVFKLLREEMSKMGEKSTVVFLGDNLYPRGLPDSTSKKRIEMEKKLMVQAGVLNQYKGKGYFIPGNHDWDKGQKHGWKNVQNAASFLEQFTGDSTLWQPSGGCPGPVEIPIEDDIVMIIIDTQWWLHYQDKPGVESDCEVKSDAEFLFAINDAIVRNRDKRIIVAGHHPLKSNGLHGGHAKPATHLFPLTDLKDNLYVPMPVLGSIYVFYRTVLGNIQDIPHPRYQMLCENLLQIFAQHPGLVYACGHDHSLQLLEDGATQLVVSGAGSKTDYISRNQKAAFAHNQKGFARLDFHQNEEVWLSFMIPSEGGNGSEVVFRKKLPKQEIEAKKSLANTDLPSFQGQKVEKEGTQLLAAKGLKASFLGKNYRNEWHEPIKGVPVFDIETERGGLKIIKRGGGMQTKSLRLEAKDGRQYVLRSIEKFPEKAVPLALRGTLAAAVVEDQISASHPYAAFVIPPLAKAAGVHHANPQLVYLPDDPRLGDYQEDFGGGLYLYEERANDDFWKDYDSFGKPRDIKSTPKVLLKTKEDNDKLVNQAHVLRSRLFDIWIGDWDRHDDQWRWAEFKDKKKDIKYYEPIPRDRDQAFFDSDGLLMAVGTRKWGMRKFQGFKSDVRDPAGFGFNARYFDRSFLTEPSLEDWQNQAKEFQQILTDTLIENAIRQFPSEIFQHHGESIIQKLKDRREGLVATATTFYKELARNVNVTGSDKHELFKVERLNDEETRVRVWKIKKDSDKKKHKMYDRVFNTNETKEIRLFGFGGEDVFELEGSVNKGIKIRIVGGDGFDTFKDASGVKGPSKKTLLYDNITGNSLQLGKEAKNMTSAKPEVNQYDRKAFQYDLLSPTGYFAFNPDDGVFIGGGFLSKKHGFRKTPFKTSHMVRANFAPVTSSFNLEYLGEYIHTVGSLDFLLEADLRQPSFVDFFYGLGNETLNEREIFGNTYYRVRYTQVFVNPELRKRWKDGKHQFKVGLGLQFIELLAADDDETAPRRFIFDQYTGQDSLQLFEEEKFFASFNTSYQFDSRNSTVLPTKGMVFKTDARRVTGLNDETLQDIDFWQLSGEFSFFLSTPDRPRFQTTWASRIGGATNFGDYQEAFQANTLGGQQNLRGFRRMRFAGDKTAYFNNELRIALANVNTYLFPFKLGIHGFYDVGRVWVENDPSTASGNSDIWHRGYGGGIWMTPFQFAALSFEVSTSEEEQVLPFIRFGFMF